MTAFVHDALPWIMSAITLYMTFLQGRKTWKAWAVGLVNQLLWLWFIITMQTWGLLLLNAGLWYLYARNLRIWYDDEKALRYQRQAVDGVPFGKTATLSEMKRWYESTDELKR